MRIVLTVSLVLLLAGCATGVKMTEAEARACAQQGCTAWTDAELQDLVLRAMREGYRLGAQGRGTAL